MDTAPAEAPRSDEVVADFFQEEFTDLPRRRDKDGVSTSSVATVRSMFGRALGRTSAHDLVGLEGTRSFSLRELCDFFQGHPSLKTVGIASCSCYTQPSAFRFVTHRFLVFRLERSGKDSSVWLRLDRRPATESGPSAFVSTASNDSAVLATTPDELNLAKASEESRLNLDSAQNPLASLVRILLNVMETMKKYKLLSENCWIFSAYILESFHNGDDSNFTHGAENHRRLAGRAAAWRERVEVHRLKREYGRGWNYEEVGHINATG